MGTNTVKKEISLYKGAEMTETEIKSMIDKDLYESILNAFTWEKVREQKNYCHQRYSWQSACIEKAAPQSCL